MASVKRILESPQNSSLSLDIMYDIVCKLRSQLDVSSIHQY